MMSCFKRINYFVLLYTLLLWPVLCTVSAYTDCKHFHNRSEPDGFLSVMCVDTKNCAEFDCHGEMNLKALKMFVELEFTVQIELVKIHNKSEHQPEAFNVTTVLTIYVRNRLLRYRQLLFRKPIIKQVHVDIVCDPQYDHQKPPLPKGYRTCKDIVIPPTNRPFPPTASTSTRGRSNVDTSCVDKPGRASCGRGQFCFNGWCQCRIGFSPTGSNECVKMSAHPSPSAGHHSSRAHGHSSNKTGLIIALTVAGLAVCLIILGVGIFVVYRKRQNAARYAQHQPLINNEDDDDLALGDDTTGGMDLGARGAIDSDDNLTI